MSSWTLITGDQKTDEQQQKQQPPELRESEQTPEPETKASSETATAAEIKEPSEGATDKAGESPVKSKDEATVAESGEGKPRHPVSKMESFGSTSDDGSDDEKPKKDQLLVEYIDNPDELTVEVKRSSGSVSFFGAQEALAPYPVPKSPPPDLPTIEQSMELLSTDVSAAAAPLDGSVGEKSREGTGDSSASPETEPNSSETAPKSEAADEVVPKEQPTLEEESEPREKTVADEKEEQPQGDSLTKTEPEAEAKQSSSSEKPPLLEAATTQAPQPGVSSAPGTLPAAQGAPLPPLAQPAPLPRTPLPPPPPTIEPAYIDRSGWLTKLSHKKGNIFFFFA